MNHEDVKQRLLANPETREAYEHPPLALIIARSAVERRRQLGMSQEELSQALGTSQTQVWRIESGQANLTIGTLQKLADVLGLPVLALLKGTRGSAPGRFGRRRRGVPSGFATRRGSEKVKAKTTV